MFVIRLIIVKPRSYQKKGDFKGDYHLHVVYPEERGICSSFVHELAILYCQTIVQLTHQSGGDIVHAEDI